MDKREFAQRAHDICLESFKAYFVENDLPKSMRYMNAESLHSFCLHPKNSLVSCDDFVRDMMPMDDFQAQARIDALKEELTFLAEDFCIILLRAKLEFIIDKCYKMLLPCRVSYFVTCKDDQLEIIHLHFAVPHQTIRTSKLHAALDENTLFDESMSKSELLGPAVAAGLYSPNALLYYSLAQEQPITFVNNTLLKLLGYTDSNDFFHKTAGTLEQLVEAQDLPLFTKKLAKHTPGKIIAFNLHCLKADGSAFPVLLRAKYALQKEPHYILSITPLEVPPEELDCGQQLPSSTPENYTISFELFMKLALDSLAQYGRKNGRSYGNNNSHILQLTASVLNASNAWLDDVRDPEANTRLLASYTAPGAHELKHLPLQSQELLQIIHKFKNKCYNSLQEYPEPLRTYSERVGITSGIHEIIEYDGQEAFVLHIFRQNDATPWTEHELNIAHQAARIYKSILKDYPLTENTDAADAKGGSL
ncbi:MAG: hypothetical protein SO119_02670 [Phascolarctobacterium sp.]|nr:hypothetical protein [Phascolarctobacterium sp.]